MSEGAGETRRSWQGPAFAVAITVLALAGLSFGLRQLIGSDDATVEEAGYRWSMSAEPTTTSLERTLEDGTVAKGRLHQADATVGIEVVAIVDGDGIDELGAAEAVAAELGGKVSQPSELGEGTDDLLLGLPYLWADVRTDSAQRTVGFLNAARDGDVIIVIGGITRYDPDHDASLLLDHVARVSRSLERT